MGVRVLRVRVLRVMVFVALLWFKRLGRIRVRGVGYRVSWSIMMPLVVRRRVHRLLLLL